MSIWAALGSGALSVLLVGGAIACLAIWLYALLNADDKTRFLLKTGIAVLVIAVGGGQAYLLVISRKKPRTRPPGTAGALVEVMRAKRVNRSARVEAMGTVLPARELELRAEVGGRILKQSERLVPGSVLRAGEVLCEIDPRDYQAALEARRADLERARTALKLEEGRGEIARREWELLGKDVDDKGTRKDLALRKPQLAQARAAVKAAESAVAKAKLDLERTTITVPFPAVVREEFVEVGQLVSPQAAIARLVGAEECWVRCSVPTDRLEHVTLPGPDGRGGAPARIFQSRPGGGPAVRSGRVIRLLPELDPAGRMARVLIVVRDPLNVTPGVAPENGTGTGERRSGKPPPLLLGSFVRVEIDGPALNGVVPLPRKALREGSRVWVMNAKGKLEIREAGIAWGTRAELLLSSGVEAGEAVVTTGINGAYPGMKLRLPGEQKPGSPRSGGRSAPANPGRREEAGR
jgi:RND family efflux transporter MFP subunit